MLGSTSDRPTLLTFPINYPRFLDVLAGDRASGEELLIRQVLAKYPNTVVSHPGCLHSPFASATCHQFLLHGNERTRVALEETIPSSTPHGGQIQFDYLKDLPKLVFCNNAKSRFPHSSFHKVGGLDSQRQSVMPFLCIAVQPCGKTLKDSAGFLQVPSPEANLTTMLKSVASHPRPALRVIDAKLSQMAPD